MAHDQQAAGSGHVQAVFLKVSWRDGILVDSGQNLGSGSTAASGGGGGQRAATALKLAGTIYLDTK